MGTLRWGKDAHKGGIALCYIKRKHAVSDIHTHGIQWLEGVIWYVRHACMNREDRIRKRVCKDDHGERHVFLAHRFIYWCFHQIWPNHGDRSQGREPCKLILNLELWQRLRTKRRQEGRRSCRTKDNANKGQPIREWELVPSIGNCTWFLGVDGYVDMGRISSTGRSGRNTRVIMGAWSIHVAEHRWLESYVQRLSVHRHKLTAQRAI
jgi:hypothetical protein